MAEHEHFKDSDDSESAVAASRKPLRDSAFRTLANWISQILVSVVLILSARNYSFENFSFLATALAASSALVALVDFGTTSQWTVFLSQKSMSLTKWSNLVEYKFNIGILLVLISILTSIFVGPIVAVSSLLFILVLGQQSLNVYFTTTSKNHISGYSAIIDRTLALMLCLVFLVLPVNIDPTIIIYLPFLIGPLASAMFLYFHVPKSFRPRLVSTFSIQQYARGSKWFAITSIASALRGVDVILLSILTSAFQTSLYASVSKMVVPVNTAATALSSITTPHFSQGGLNRKVFKLVRPSFMLLFGVCGSALIAALFSREIVVFLLGTKYADASMVLAILLFAGVASAVGIVSTSTLEAIGKQFISSVTSVITIAVQLLLSIILIPTFGALGAALALATSTSLALVILTVVVLRSFAKG